MAESSKHIEWKDSMGCVQRTVKRAVDMLFSFVGLVLLSPVFLVISVMLKRQHNGTVFFHQERIGYRGVPFRICKFRTMSSAVEKNGPCLVAECNEKMSTPLEKFLRVHHLDELPQLWNVLKGDMSLVGPRPERKYFIDKIMEHNSDYVYLYKMRPGLTSEATLYNGYTDTMEKMLKRLDMDLNYLSKRSLLLDAEIFFKTLFSVVGGKKI